MYYNENENDEVESELETESEAEIDNDASVASDATPAGMSRQQAAKAMKLADPGYNITNKRVGSKTVKIEMYSTRSNPGHLIRDPVRGTRFNDKVGSLAEHAYFKVRMASIGDGIDPVTLYYDSPEAYEVHQRSTVPFSTKMAWQEKKRRHGF
jgi:hypothetical protein